MVPTNKAMRYPYMGQSRSSNERVQIEIRPKGHFSRRFRLIPSFRGISNGTCIDLIILTDSIMSNTLGDLGFSLKFRRKSQYD